jgi:hypothetical protein
MIANIPGIAQLMVRRDGYRVVIARRADRCVRAEALRRLKWVEMESAGINLILACDKRITRRLPSFQLIHETAQMPIQDIHDP